MVRITSLGEGVDRPVRFAVAAAGLGLSISAVVLFPDGWLWLAAAVGALCLVWAVFSHPELGLAILVFVLYTRASDALETRLGVPSFTLPLALLVLAAVWARWWFGGVPVPRWDQPALLLGAYGGVSLASLLYAPQAAPAQAGLLELAKNTVIVLAVCVSLRRAETLRHVVWALLAAGILLGTLTVYQRLTGTFANDYWGFAQSEVKNIIGDLSGHRAAGPMGSTNYYAMILVVLVPLAIDRGRNERPLALRVLAHYALVVCVLAIVFTFSRGGFLALCLVLAGMFRPRPLRLRRLILSGALVVLGLQWVPATYTQRLTTLFDLLPGSGQTATGEISFRGRLSEVLVAWQMFTDHPIGGVGLRNFKPAYQSYARPLGLEHRREARDAHNLYLEVAAETGLVGLATFGAILVAAAHSLYRGRRSLLQAGDPVTASLVTALAVGFGGYLVASLFLHSAYPRYFWLLISLALAVPRLAPTPRGRGGRAAPLGGPPAEAALGIGPRVE